MHTVISAPETLQCVRDDVAWTYLIYFVNAKIRIKIEIHVRAILLN